VRERAGEREVEAEQGAQRQAHPGADERQGKDRQVKQWAEAVGLRHRLDRALIGVRAEQAPAAAGDQPPRRLQEVGLAG